MHTNIPQLIHAMPQVLDGGKRSQEECKDDFLNVPSQSVSLGKMRFSDHRSQCCRHL